MVKASFYFNFKFFIILAVACFLFLIFFYLRETWRITRQSAVSDGGSDKWDPVFKTTLT